MGTVKENRVAAATERGKKLLVVDYHERRKGTGRLLKTLTMMLSLVTASICGPGNWPLISIPCITATFS